MAEHGQHSLNTKFSNPTLRNFTASYADAEEFFLPGMHEKKKKVCRAHRSSILESALDRKGQNVIELTGLSIHLEELK